MSDDNSSVNYGIIYYHKLVKECKRYHYYITSKSKTFFLSKSNSKREAKTLALNKLKPNINNLIGRSVIFVRVKDKEEEFDKSGNGGPIIIIFKKGLIVDKDTIKNYDDENLLFRSKKHLSEDYIEKNKLNILIDIEKYIYDYELNRLDDGCVIN
jgi:hypothetical protein